MISADTNVLLRYLLQDDDVQSPKANKIMAGKQQVLITDVVLIEAMWTLKGKKYKLKKDKLLLVLEQLFKEPNIVFENANTVWRAVNDFRFAKAVKVGSKKKEADFSDALIVEKSKYDCDRKDLPFEGLYTFDVAAREINGTKEP